MLCAAADCGRRCCVSDGSVCGAGRYSSELQLVCGPERDSALLLVRRAGCRFTFLWETPAACRQQVRRRRRERAGDGGTGRSRHTHLSGAVCTGLRSGDLF